MLTDDEKEFINLVAELWKCFVKINGNNKMVAEGDTSEFIFHIHALQNMALAQSAARVYPDRYRLLGEACG